MNEPTQGDCREGQLVPDDVTILLRQLEGMLTIHPDRLLTDWQQQPAQHLAIGHVQARSTTAVLEARLVVKQHMAKLDRQFRECGIPRAAGQDGPAPKVTDKAIEAAIEADETLYSLRMRLVALEERASIMSHMVSASGQRVTALKHITMLTIPMGNDPETEAEANHAANIAARAARAGATVTDEMT